MMTSNSDIANHKPVTQAVHENGGLIAMQILHSGRYAYHFNPVSASPLKSPISWYAPKVFPSFFFLEAIQELTSAEIQETIRDFAACAAKAKQAGYDGVEVMGSEGYLINQFIAKNTNKRTDEWGGSYANRIRLAIEIVKAVRQAVGRDFIVIYRFGRDYCHHFFTTSLSRLSMLDLVANGSSWDEITELALRIEDAGASIINTGCYFVFPFHNE
jgi:2,4-dienoyl-CoA reductase (NADPH2)